MNTGLFLETLRSRDIQVWAEAGQLRCSAPPGALSTEFREELRQRKADILKFLDTAASLARQQRAIIPLQPRGTGTPVFAVAGHNGDVFTYRTLVKYLGEERPFFGLQPPGLDGQSKPLRRVEDLAAYFAEQIRAFQPDSPYIIAGYCAGGTIAFELAQQLRRAAAEISSLVLFGAPYATSYGFSSQMRLQLEAQWRRLTRHAKVLTSLSGIKRRSYIREKLKLIFPSNRNAAPGSPLSAFDGVRDRARASLAEEVRARRIKVQRATFAALARYNPTQFPGRVVLLVPSRSWAQSSRQPLRWRSVADRAEEHYGPDDCHTDIMLLEPHVRTFAELFRRAIEGDT